MRIPGYTFDSRLYQSETTLVYAGWREADRVPVVGKRVRGSARLLQEELAGLQRVAGEGVVEAIGVVDSDDGPVLLERRFGDQNLAQALRSGRMPIGRALRISLGIARGLARIHACRIVHRDIKPDNILLDSQRDAVVIADFGTAAELPVQARALPISDIVGTPSYVSPEQTGRMSFGCDFRSDLYSLGITLYELVTGTLPFESQELLELVSCHMSKVPELPHARVQSVPQVLSALIMKLIGKLPEERYQSACGLAADLERCIAMLSADGSIPGFELGLSDRVRPRVPNRPLGREKEYAALCDTLERAKRGTPSLVVISGAEGSGRRELGCALLRDNPCAYTASGGWARAGERPLSGLSEALSLLARRLLLLEDEVLAKTRSTLNESLGVVGQVLLDIAPELGDVLGQQPALPPVGAAEAQARLHHAFGQFLTTLGKDAVCVLTLHNLELADAATLSLLTALLDSAEGGRVLVVASVSDTTPLGALAEHPSTVHVALPALDAAAVEAWLAYALDCAAERARSISAMLLEKSAGNPALLINLIEHLVDTDIIQRKDGAFTWQAEAVRTAHAPQSLATLVSQRVAELGDGPRQALAALACAGDACDPPALAAMTDTPPTECDETLASLERGGLVSRNNARYVIPHAAIAEAALGNLPNAAAGQMLARLARHLLKTTPDIELSAHAFRIARALDGGRPELIGDERLRAAEVYALAGAQMARLLAYDVAASFFESGLGLLGSNAFSVQRGLTFNLELGLGRVLTMLEQGERAELVLKTLCQRQLSFQELYPAYLCRSDNRTRMSDRDGACAVLIEGLARCGIKIPAHPSAFRALPRVFANQRKLAKLSHEQFLGIKPTTDARVEAAQWLLTGIASPAFLLRRTNLYLLVSETTISLALEHGLAVRSSGLFSTHASVLLGGLKKYEAARQQYEACLKFEQSLTPAEVVGRGALPLYYFLHPWFASWAESADLLTRGVAQCIAEGDTLFTAFCASGAIQLRTMCGVPLPEIARQIENWRKPLAGQSEISASMKDVLVILQKLSRGDAIAQEDLDAISNMPAESGSIRNNPMVSLGLALTLAGHEPQVRRWLDEIRPTFHRVNFCQPQIANLWLLDALFAAKDARSGKPKRLKVARRIVRQLRTVQRRTGCDNFEPLIVLIEAEIARAMGELERAAGTYMRAVAEARKRKLEHLVAFAMEQRAQICDQVGASDEAAILYREAYLAYQRWGHVLKQRELLAARPQLKVLQASEFAGQLSETGGSARTRGATIQRSVAQTRPGTLETLHGNPSRALNEALDLTTVLKVSQDISTQLHGSGVVRAVLSGIAQNAGADRVLFVLRDASGQETAYADFSSGNYREIGESFADYAEAPRSVVRLMRRTAKPVVVSDATSDPSHASDPFVARARCRSVAGIPVIKNNVVTGYVVLENRLVTGAFTPKLIDLVRALVAQAAISLDNASLYETMEQRVRERTAELNAGNVEMRRVLDTVAQGLVTADREGRLASQCSAVLSVWFPEGVPATLTGFFEHDARAASLFGLGWEQLWEEILPLELCIDQLPRYLARGEQTFELHWRPIFDESQALARMLLVMSDVTELLRRRVAEQQQKQLMAAFERLTQDRGAVREFFKEASQIVERLERTAAPELEKRLIHTLKGNCALFGLQALSALCHDLESATEVDARTLSVAERARLSAEWSAFAEQIAPFLNMGQDTIQVTKREYEAALQLIESDPRAALHEIELWPLEPLDTRFRRIGEGAQALAKRLGKGRVRICSEHNRFRIDVELWAPFWAAFVHAVRNAIDHGLENAEERQALGKEMATLTLRAYSTTSSFVLEFHDNGRGVPWSTIRHKARAAGLPADSHDDLVTALFRVGLSSKEHVDDLSGRGVGMSALLEAAAALGGKVFIDSQPGQGTQLRFEFPPHLARATRERRHSVSPSVAPPPN